MAGGQANSSKSSATPSNPMSCFGALESPRLPDEYHFMCPRCSTTFLPSDALLEDIRKKLIMDNMFPSLEHAKPFPTLQWGNEQNLAYWSSLLATTFRHDSGPNGQGFIPVRHPVSPWSGANGGYETLSRAHQLDLNQPPYPMPENNNMMPWEMNLGQPRAGLGDWLGNFPPTAAAAADANTYVGASKREEDFNENYLVEKLDLTLKL